MPKTRLGIVGFDHVDLRVRNLNGGRRFFVDRLGLEVIGEGFDHLFLLFGDQVLGLRRSRSAAPRQDVDHVALRIGRWSGVRRTLERRGVVVTGTKTRDESRSLFLRGPEGLKVELVYRPNPHRHPVH